MDMHVESCSHGLISEAELRVAFLLVGAALALSACTENFDASVKRFQQMPPPAGQSFTIVATDPKLSNSLEFAQYANRVAGRLGQQGYTAAATPQSATLIVHVDYGVDKGRVMTDMTSFCDGWGGCGGGLGYGYGFGGFGYGPWSPFYGGYAFGFDPYMWGPETDIQSQIIYTSGFDMEIDRASDHQRVFEGHAKAVSSVDNLTYLVPNLIDAMFTNFPGKSGETVKITIAPPKKH